MSTDIDLHIEIRRYNDHYHVSDQGDVWSVRARRFLKPGRMPSGHLSVALGRGNSRTVHSLVLETFVGPRPPGADCRHLNGNPADNRLTNLCWGSRAQNIRDKKWHGAPRKLTVAQVREIKAGLSAGQTGCKLARKYGVSPTTVSTIRNGHTHGDV